MRIIFMMSPRHLLLVGIFQIAYLGTQSCLRHSSLVDTTPGTAKHPLYNSPYDDEKATTYEIGMKNDISKNVRLNVAAYYTAFDDMQIVVVPSPMNPVERSTVNAGQVDIYGLEVDAEARITDELTVTGGYAYTAYQINKVTDEYGVLGAAPGGDVADDFTMAYVPENKLFVAARYEFNKTRYGRLAINASYAYQSSVDGYYWKKTSLFQ